MKLNSLRMGVALTVVLSLALVGCAGSNTPEPNTSETEGAFIGGSLSIGSPIALQTSFDTIDARPGTQVPYLQAVYDTLIRRAPDATLVPMLATEWSYNEDQTVLTLKLRDDVTFSDGEEFDATAVKANLDRFKSGGGVEAGVLSTISEIEVVDDYTVTVSLSEPDPGLLYYLADQAGYMASPAAFDGLKTTPVGSGPYEYDAASSVEGSEYVFNKREGYWSPDLQKWDTITIKVIADQAARVNALISSDIDTAQIGASAVAQVEDSNLTVYRGFSDWAGLTLLDRDGELVPALKDVRVRQAINYALDRETLLEQVIVDEGEVTNQTFAPQSDAFVADLDEYYDYDPEKAKELLADAGYGDGFEVPMPWLAIWPAALQAALTQYLGDVGITVTWVNMPVEEFFAAVGQGEYALIYRQYYQGPTSITLDQLVAPEATINPLHSSDPELDALIKTARTEPDKAAAAGKAINEFVVEQAWFAPFYRPYSLVVGNERVEIETQEQQAVPSIYNYTPTGE